jgi:hypothetical protein
MRMPLFRGTSPSPEDQFASEVITLVHGMHRVKARWLDDFALRIERPDGPAVTMDLHNIYTEVRQLDGDARAERLRRAVLAVIIRSKIRLRIGAADLSCHDV